MAVDTKLVSGRRELHFSSLNNILKDAELMVSADTQKLGNWTPGQIFKHLAQTFDSAVDGTGFRPPWLVRIGARLLKKKILTTTTKPGFQMPERMKPVFFASRKGCQR